MSSPPPTLPPAAPWTTPPTAEHLAQLAAARLRSKKIRRAVVSAQISAWSTAIFAGLTLLTSLMSAWGFILGAAMAVCAYFEFKGINQLKKLDRTSLPRMSNNQLVFGIILFLYGAISLYSTINAPLPTELQDADLQSMIGTDYRHMSNLLYGAMYGIVMLAAIIGPGYMALYYRTRVQFVDAYLKETPQWILDLQRAGMSV